MDLWNLFLSTQVIFLNRWHSNEGMESSKRRDEFDLVHDNRPGWGLLLMRIT